MTNDQPSKRGLLPLDALIATSEVDHADWNYRPGLGSLQRKRFSLALKLLGAEPYDRLLEVGYGSGVFLPELAARCRELYGVDPHQHHRDVAEVLERRGVRAELTSSSAEQMPYEDAFVDGIVSISALEYVLEIDQAAAELARILKPGGALVVVTPGHSPILDRALKVTTGEDAYDNYEYRRQGLLPALLRQFRLVDHKNFPPLLGGLALYRALRFTHRQA